MFASPQSQYAANNNPYQASSATMTPNRQQQPQQQQQRAATPNSTSSPSQSRRANNQHNRPTQISFAGFGKEEESNSKNNANTKPTPEPNEGYLGQPYQQQQQQPISDTSFYQYHQQQERQNQHHHASAISPEHPHHQQQSGRRTPNSNTNNNTHQSNINYYDHADDDNKLQKCFQNDIVAAKPLFSARQISTRHLQSGFQLFGSKNDTAVLYTDRMLVQKRALNNNNTGATTTTSTTRSISAGASTRNNSVFDRGMSPNVITAVPEDSASPVVVDYHDDVGHGKKTQRAMQLERKQQGRDNAKAFVERNGISILGRMQAEEEAGSATNSLPGVMNRKNRVATPSSSETHMRGVGQVADCKADGSKFKFARKVHPDARHVTNLTKSLLPIRKIVTPSVDVLAVPPQQTHGGRSARVGPRHAVDTNRVLCPDMIPETRHPRLRSLAPPEMLGQGMEIKEDAPQWTWKGGLKGGYLADSDPFGGDI